MAEKPAKKQSDEKPIPGTNLVPMRSIDSAEVESQIATAKRYPRDIREFKDRLMTMANLDQETAESCYYALPRAGRTIDGPSVRLAEIAFTNYKNLIADAFVSGEDGVFVYATGTCKDLENNVAARVTIRRRIVDKAGNRYNEDMIGVTGNAACSIAFRNAIFKVIPGAYIKPVFEQVKRTAVGKASSLGTTRAEVFKRLTQFGATKERILRVIGRKSVDEVTIDDVSKLIGLGTAIKDGETTVEEAFPPLFEDEQKRAEKDVADKQGSETVEQPKAGGKKSKKAKNKTEPKQEVKTRYVCTCAKGKAGFDELLDGKCPHCLSVRNVKEVQPESQQAKQTNNNGGKQKPFYDE
jgi:hypothetical protein